MKRLLFIAVLWGAALLPLTAQAQRGMGFRGGGVAPRGPSGFAGRPSGFAPRPGFARPGFVGSPAGFPGRGFAARPGPVTRGTAGVRFVSPQSHVFISGRRAFFPHHNRFHHFGHNPFFSSFNSCFNGFFDPFCNNGFFNNGFFFGSGFIGPFDPFFSGFSYPFSYPYAYSQPEPQQPVAVEQDSNSRELALEVQELSDEIRFMREEQQRREERNTAATRPAVQDLSPETIFVLRDGRQLSTRNYAIAGETLWVLDEHKARKIPFATLDIPATEQANAKNGVEIHLKK